MRLTSLATGAIAAAIAATAIAQAAANDAPGGTRRFAGTITAVQGAEVTIALQGGDTVEFMLVPDTHIALRQAVRVSDLAAGRFVGCTAVEHAAGRLIATECHIFPEAMRGAGEGHYPWELPATTMTNGNITSMTNGSVQSASGSAKDVVLDVTYKGGEQKIEITPTTQVTLIRPGNASVLRRGESVVGAARKGAQDRPTIEFIDVTQ